MNSVVLKFDNVDTVSNIIMKIKSSGSNLELSPMTETTVAGQPKVFNQLLVIGELEEIINKLSYTVGEDWKKYVVQGETGEVE